MKTAKQDEWAMRVVDRMLRFYDRIFADVAEDLDKHFLTEGWQLKATLESTKPITPTLFWPKEDKIASSAKSMGELAAWQGLGSYCFVAGVFRLRESCPQRADSRMGPSTRRRSGLLWATFPRRFAGPDNRGKGKLVL
jgi:hypothetical protein